MTERRRKTIARTLPTMLGLISHGAVERAIAGSLERFPVHALCGKRSFELADWRIGRPSVRAYGPLLLLEPTKQLEEYLFRFARVGPFFE
jgi:hypothetical protein